MGSQVRGVAAGGANASASLRELEQAANPERVLDRVRILELANKAHSLYVTQTPAEKAKLLRMVLSNCAVDAVSVYPTYRKRFDMIFERAKTRNGGAGESRTPDTQFRKLLLYPSELQPRHENRNAQ